MQTTTGFRAALSLTFVYSLVQKIIGSEESRNFLYKNVIDAPKNSNILDIGCGPANSLAHLGDVNYWGYDISPEYIESAKKRYTNTGNFHCKYFEESDLLTLPKMDTVIMLGVLHHMDDDEALRVINLAKKALNKGGRLITVDPVYEKGQNIIARFLISLDRGGNVRKEAGYKSLLQEIFTNTKSMVRHKKFIPYTNCISVSHK